LACLLTILALFSISLAISSFPRSSQGASALGSAVFFPRMFFAGLWVPREVMPDALRAISDLTPLGAGVQAIEFSMNHGFPPVAPLLVMAGYAVIFGAIAIRSFRWE
jgi:ABC-2 type transport system permease protein